VAYLPAAPIPKYAIIQAQNFGKRKIKMFWQEMVICPECGQEVEVTDRGYLIEHSKVIYGALGFTSPCPGGGRKAGEKEEG